MSAPAAFAEALISAGADAPFTREGMMFLRVPRWIVEAYAAARLERRDVLATVMIAAFGEPTYRECLAAPQVMAWTIARGWLGRLGDLERQVRRLPARPA
jgi:hypothetical protein